MVVVVGKEGRGGLEGGRGLLVGGNRMIRGEDGSTWGGGRIWV